MSWTSNAVLSPYSLNHNDSLKTMSLQRACSNHSDILDFVKGYALARRLQGFELWRPDKHVRVHFCETRDSNWLDSCKGKAEGQKIFM